MNRPNITHFFVLSENIVNGSGVDRIRVFWIGMLTVSIQMQCIKRLFDSEATIKSIPQDRMPDIFHSEVDGFGLETDHHVSSYRLIHILHSQLPFVFGLAFPFKTLQTKAYYFLMSQ